MHRRRRDVDVQLNMAKTEVIRCSSSQRQDQIPQVALRVGNDSVMPASSMLHIYVDSRRINEDAHFQDRVQLLRRTASNPQHSSISLTADSAIAGGVLGTDTPRLR